VAVRTVLQLGDPGLREVAARVDDASSPEIHSLVGDLADTLAHWRATTGYGRGIAAPQIGAAKRVIFLQLPGAEPWPLVNPEITWRSEGMIVVWDACLSFLSIFMQVERHREITVRYQDLRGEWKEIRASEERNLSELCNTRSTIWTGFWPSTASQICARCARVRNSRRSIAHRARMRSWVVQVSRGRTDKAMRKKYPQG